MITSNVSIPIFAVNKTLNVREFFQSNTYNCITLNKILIEIFNEIQLIKYYNNDKSFRTGLLMLV